MMMGERLQDLRLANHLSREDLEKQRGCVDIIYPALRTAIQFPQLKP
jgi:hypothetical protein